MDGYIHRHLLLNVSLVFHQLSVLGERFLTGKFLGIDTCPTLGYSECFGGLYLSFYMFTYPNFQFSKTGVTTYTVPVPSLGSPTPEPHPLSAEGSTVFSQQCNYLQTKMEIILDLSKSRHFCIFLHMILETTTQLKDNKLSVKTDLNRLKFLIYHLLRDLKQVS